MDKPDWPKGLTPPLARILGMMCFHVAQYAHAYAIAGEFLDAEGQPLDGRAEHEQAFLLHRWIGYWFEHGDGWEKVATDDINRVAALANSIIAAQREGKVQ